jgi:2'-5' RNA ligase
VPDEAGQAVQDALAPLRTRFPEVRWMARDLLHLTLVFLGDTDAARVPELTAVMGDVAARYAPYEVDTANSNGHADDRRHRRSGVAWLTLGRGRHETQTLALDVDAATGANTYDGRRPPHPHLTVARSVSPDALAALRDLAPSIDVSWRADRMVLFRSHTGPRGSRYEEVKVAPLTGTATRA